LKDVMIGAVNQNDFGWTPAESLGCRQAAKTPTDNNDTGQMVVHNFACFAKGARLLYANSHFWFTADTGSKRSNAKGRTGLCNTDLHDAVKPSARKSL